MDYTLAADIVVTAHVAFVLFVVIGQLLIVLGWLLGWQWVRNFWFRLVHLGSILFVVAEALFGVVCPLTTWERQLRILDGAEDLHDLANASAIGRFCNEILFYPVNPLFTVGYVVFAVLVVLTWVCAPARSPWQGQIDALRSAIDALRSEVADLRAQLDTLEHGSQRQSLPATTSKHVSTGHE